MIQEILYKLSEILGIKTKIMEYDDQKEGIYLTVIIPLFIGQENDVLISDIDEMPIDGKMSNLAEVSKQSFLYNNNNKEKIVIDKDRKKK